MIQERPDALYLESVPFLVPPCSGYYLLRPRHARGHLMPRPRHALPRLSGSALVASGLPVVPVEVLSQLRVLLLRGLCGPVSNLEHKHVDCLRPSDIKR